MIKSRAAVACAPNQPRQIVEIDVAPPRAGEVRRRIVATGAPSFISDFACRPESARNHWARARHSLDREKHVYLYPR